MSNNVAINTVYNHYLTAYAPKGTSRYDTHKKSELRNICDSIVKLNKESPLYMLDTTRDSREYVVGLKENARQLHNTIASLGGLSETEMLNKKAAYSSNEELVSASFVGSLPENGEIPSFQVEVTALASNQANLGTFLPSNEEVQLPADAYSFDISINDLSYEFQYNIHDGETNRDIQERLARLISNADIGILADILEDGKGNAALKLTSVSSGLKEEKEYIFLVSDDKTTKRAGSVDYLGLGHISQLPSNAAFLLNGEEKSASSNHFTVDKTFELTLNKVSDSKDDIAQVGVKTDLDSLTENVGNLISGYNSFIRSASEYMGRHPRSGKLLSEMERMSRYHQTGLNALGFDFAKDGQITLNDSAFRGSVLEQDGSAQLTKIRDFTNSILRKADQISLNPIEYVDKTIVAYKNPGHNFATPYVTSNYSGLFFNSYC